jgi:hypothetical protein
MIFSGIKNEKEAGDLWAYLKQFDQNGEKKQRMYAASPAMPALF